MKTEKQLQTILEKNGFKVNVFYQDGMKCAELETFTKGGVNMIPCLVPYTAETFIEYVESFNIDNEIDLHRTMKLYKMAFTMRQSLADFDRYSKLINRIAKQLTK